MNTAIGLCRFCLVGVCKAHLVAAFKDPPIPQYGCDHRQSDPLARRGGAHRESGSGTERSMKAWLARLEDFRLLPVFVVVSMAIGIAIGNLLQISDFALTPPIDALKSIAGGTFELTVPNAISLGRADRPVRDDVPGDDQRPPGRGRRGLPLAASARRRAGLQLPGRAVRDARPGQHLRVATRSCAPGSSSTAWRRASRWSSSSRSSPRATRRWPSCSWPSTRSSRCCSSRCTRGC